jgi:hypothetical protein
LADLTALRFAINSFTNVDRADAERFWIGHQLESAAYDEMPSVRRHGMFETSHQMNGLPPVTAIVVPDT